MKIRWPWRRRKPPESRDYIRFDYDTRYVTICKPGRGLLAVPMSQIIVDVSTGNFSVKPLPPILDRDLAHKVATDLLERYHFGPMRRTYHPTPARDSFPKEGPSHEDCANPDSAGPGIPGAG